MADLHPLRIETRNGASTDLRFRAIVVSLFAAIALLAATSMANAKDMDELYGPVLVSQQQQGSGFSTQEVVDQGHVFFGHLTQGLGQAVESLADRYGEPNGYILGEEASAAFIGGLRYGEGILYTRNAGNHRVYWQGPSLGLDWGGEGTRVMMLVYNLPSVDSLYQRFPGASGSAFLVGGLSVSAVQAGNTVIAPMRTGIGARLGLNVGYLKFTRQATWNPF